jgi:hypothetical protein
MYNYIISNRCRFTPLSALNCYLIVILLCRFCPACLEFADNRKDGRKKVMFLFAYHSSLSTSSTRDTTPKLRYYHEFSKNFPICKYGKLVKNVRMMPLEKLRRQLVVSYRALTAPAGTASFVRSHISKLEEFLGVKNEVDRTFLDNSNPICVSTRGKMSSR